MLWRRVSTWLAGLSLLGAGVAGAQQTTQLKLTAAHAPYGTAVVSPFGYYMSPYAGTVGSETNVRLNCVDFFHTAVINQPWTVFKTNLGALATAVAGGNLSPLQYTRAGSSPLYGAIEAVNIYKQIAWLTDQYAANPGGANANQTKAIQTAIWAIANNRPNNAFTSLNQWQGSIDPTNTSNITTGYWIGQAQSQYWQQSANYYDKFYILADVNFMTASNGGRQEFIYSSTPEPGTLVLLGSGVAALAARAAKRRKKTGAGALEDAAAV